MKSLCITLRTNRPVVLPIAYNELVQGLLYSCWKTDLPEVHDFTLGDGKQFRPFVFSRLEGRCSADGKARTIKFYKYVRFEVRSYFDELMAMCATSLEERDRVRIGTHDFELVGLETRDCLLFPSRCIMRMRTPVVAYDTLEDGHTKPYSPAEPRWLSLVQQNAWRKAEALGLPAGAPFQAIAYQETLNDHVTRFKGTFVTGYTGDILVATDPMLLSVLWCCGLGAKNSQGFGMFDIRDEPMR